ncbi:hypothetical protein [Actinomadura coerulea]|uniref:hypothetical protein n=1 Tax=Actinomadura coerulea TaxID=46159 RepID=UPI003445265B
MLKPSDTLVIYKPDRIARTMKELFAPLEDEQQVRNVNLEILTGICPAAGPNGQTIADKRLFKVAAMAAEMGREPPREPARPVGRRRHAAGGIQRPGEIGQADWPAARRPPDLSRWETKITLRPLTGLLDR